MAEAKVEKPAEPFRAAVAPVKMRVGLYFGVVAAEARRWGRTAWEKWKAPLL